MHPMPEHVAFSESDQALIGSEEFPWETVFSDLDEPLKAIREAPPTARQEAAELFRQLASWCFRGDKPLRTATMKFAVIIAGIRPDLPGDRTMGEIAIELGCTKQNLAHQAVKFQDAFGIRFARCRSKEAREHMRKARIGGPNRNVKHGEIKTTHPTS